MREGSTVFVCGVLASSKAFLCQGDARSLMVLTWAWSTGRISVRLKKEQVY